MANEGVTTLSYPVRGPVILKYLGQLGLMLAMLTILPLSVSIFGENMPSAGDTWLSFWP